MRSRRRYCGWAALCGILIVNSQVACGRSKGRAPAFTEKEGEPQTPYTVDGRDFVKIVALVPVRDEAHLLPSCLRSLKPLVHAIVVLDDCSTDGSGDVARANAEEFKVERVARSPNCSNGESEDDAGGSNALPYWGNEAEHRGFLLDLGRSVGGTHFLTIDADEAIVVGEEGNQYAELKEEFAKMRAGDVLVLQYVTMYGSASTLRPDKQDMKVIGFVDHPAALFRRKKEDDRLHTPRIPHFPLPGKAWEMKARVGGAGPAVLHFGFSNLPNARLKNVIYNLFDLATGSKKTAAEMNAGLESQGLTLGAEEALRQAALAPAPHPWLNSLHSVGVWEGVFEEPRVPPWRETLALSLLASELASPKLPDMAALQLLLRHSFQTLSPSTQARLRRLLARLARPPSPAAAEPKA